MAQTKRTVAADGSKAIGVVCCDLMFETAAEAEAHEQRHDQVQYGQRGNKVHTAIAMIRNIASEMQIGDLADDDPDAARISRQLRDDNRAALARIIDVAQEALRSL